MSQQVTNNLLHEKNTKIAQLERALAVEAALERIRAASMAMHKSEELATVALTFFKQIEQLGIPINATSINLVNEAEESYQLYFANENDIGIASELGIKDFWFAKESFRQLKKGVKEFTVTCEGAKLQGWIDFVKKEVSLERGLRLEKAKLKQGYIYTVQFHDLSHTIFTSIAPFSETILKVLRRMTKVFGMSYIRFLDLQKAEAQAREAQIEAALERVRARTMAMHQSDELSETAALLFLQIKSFEIEPWSCGFNIWSADERTHTAWMAHPSGNIMPPLEFPNKEIPLHRQILKAANKETLFIKTLKGKALSKHFDAIRKVLAARKILDDLVELPPKLIFYAAYFKGGFLFFQTLQVSKEAENLFKRMAIVFEQSYIRFLDLQKAEAQAREAQIEASLERVRAASMAMHKSEDLPEVALATVSQLDALGIQQFGSSINIVDEKGQSFIMYSAHDALDERGKILTTTDPLVVDDARFSRDLRRHLKKGEKDFTYELKGKNLKEWMQHIKTNVDKKRGENLEQANFKKIYFNGAVFRGLSTLVISSAEPINEADRLVLRRMADTFGRSYTRFLDLQRAETQAREAQIEAALERVRASTMAMHHSSDLTKSAAVLFEQIQLLGAKVFSSGFVLCEENNPIDEQWMSVGSSKELIQQYIPHEEEPHHFNMYKAWQAGEALLTQKMEGEAMQAAFAFLTAQPSVQKNLDKIIDTDSPFPPLQILNAAYFSKGYLLIVTTETFPEKDIFIRFAKVFEQTYTRFLDLQKAEAQAREAQIEAALERVRARTMAMHKSSELSEVSTMLFKELNAFCGEILASGVVLCDREPPEQWMCSPELNMLPPIHIPKNLDKIIYNLYHAWESGMELYSEFIQGEELKLHNDALMALPEIKAIVKHASKDMYVPQSQTNYAAIFKQGYLLVITEKPFEEDALFIRFAKIFEQTYTRFLDLQKAEAQAREAQIEAALEKIRNRTLLMRDSSELNEAVAIFFKQFKSLGLLPGEARAFFGHINKEKPVIQAWMTRMDGTVMSGSHFTPLDTPSMLNFYDAWKNQTPILIRNYEGEALNNYLKFVAALPHVKNDKDYQQLFRSNPERVVMTDAFFLQGSINIMTFEPLSQEAQEMLVRFAKVFEFTYTRFLDLQKAETQAREAQIEAALERVRARAMAMHNSEELPEVLAVIFQQMQTLGFDNFNAFVLIFNLEDKNYKQWSQSFGGLAFPNEFIVPLIDHPLHHSFLKEWQEGLEFSVIKFAGKDIKTFHKFFFNLPEIKEAPQELKEKMEALEEVYFSISYIKYGALVVDGLKPLDDEKANILIRLAKVLDLTYTRMLDLQKAETQARELEIVFQENERLLHSILPKTIAEQLKRSPQTIVKRFEQVSILFADIVGFTILSERISPQEVVDILNGLFSKFDDLTDKYQLEKIKTIGDAYMVASGVPEEKENHAQLMFAFAKDMLQTLQGYNKIIGTDLKIRIGISSGPVVAGVIGKKKFAYDLWGDTVNTAARMEAYGRADCIQVAPLTYAILKDRHKFEKIPNVEIKGKGKMDVYLWKN